MAFKTQQEEFWAGEFGTRYIERNDDERLVAANTALFSQVLSKTSGVDSVLEFDAAIGLIRVALKRLLPDAEL